MQKIVKFFVLLFLLIPFVVKADSINFEPVYELDTEIKDNSVYLMISYDGDEIENISFKLAYKNSDITLLSIDSINGFKLVNKKENKKGKYTIVDLSFENEFTQTGKNYAIAEFKVDKTKNADLFFYDIDGLNIKSKFRNKGNILTLRKDNDLMVYTKSDIKSNTKIQYLLIDNMYILIGIGVILLVLFMIFINLPSKNKKSVENEEVMNNNDDIDTTFYNKDI